MRNKNIDNGPIFHRHQLTSSEGFHAPKETDVEILNVSENKPIYESNSFNRQQRKKRNSFEEPKSG
jgi:hypothetical protein